MVLLGGKGREKGGEGRGGSDGEIGGGWSWIVKGF